MARIGLLVLTKPTKLERILPAINQHVNSTLYVQLYPGRRRLQSLPSSSETVLNVQHHGPAVISIYSQATAVCHNLDVRVLLAGIKDPFISTIQTRKQIEVVIFDCLFHKDEVDNFLKSCLLNATQTCHVVTLNHPPHGNNVVSGMAESFSIDGILPNKEFKMYENVVVGGTFDRLHTGHKILLSEAVLRCTRKLTVGVTDTSMLKYKLLWELIEPCSDRMCLLEDFLQDIDPGLQYDIVPIYDPLGPTREDPNFQMIVVSTETYKGGLKVNECRCQNNLPILDIHTVDILEAVSERTCDEEEDKISSSNNRMRLLGTRLRVPEARPLLSRKPYVIGLTGNIASGKSSVGEHLRNLGAGLLNCDILAHGVYTKGQTCYESIVQHFGKEILDDDEEINRKALGAIVFKNKEQLDKLNGLVWPVLLDRVKGQIKALFEAGHQIVVMEAAVLLQAGWDKHVHEIWACIIPPEEAVKRLQERNNLTESDARARIAALPSNTELVAKAHVVVSTYWSATYTQKQVAKAWKALQLYLTDNAKL
ncbi:bifunctional coenzyme A synthase [Zootermopsis nevadensis]|uniref:Bifunctional coenzyme A synthase n=1 Tax=Zootermopsis nevadensis TaxID=136037 RepID=A0A067RJM7_ZOONE|nr:bifunctional coenzyme A synthase [Zootermopsis nevadensis]KDR23193.1 Bifunctional coenzyme A synthase [Zootermopsis nevadensis]